MDKEKLKKWLSELQPDMQDLLVFGGLGCAVVGTAMIFAPAAWILAGAALFWLGVKR